MFIVRWVEPKERGKVDRHAKVNYDLLAFAQYGVSTSLEIHGGLQFLPPVAIPWTMEQETSTEKWSVRTVFISVTQPKRQRLRPVSEGTSSYVHESNSCGVATMQGPFCGSVLRRHSEGFDDQVCCLSYPAAQPEDLRNFPH